MKEQIKKVQDYFKSKMLSGDFDIMNIDEYKLELIIDNEYKFFLWIGNLDIPKLTKPYSGELSFMDLSLSNEEAIKLNRVLLPTINKFRKETLLSQKTRELESLQKELSDITLD
jgi:hypothetical protein